MSKVIITQIKSAIDRHKKQKRTIRALGITKVNQSVELEETSQILGMIKKIQHLVKVEKN